MKPAMAFSVRPSLFGRGVAATTLAIAGLAYAANAINIDVAVNDRKQDGTPWDGCPSAFLDPPNPARSVIGHIMVNPAEPSPPEIRMIIFREKGAISTHPRQDCNNVSRCTFEAIPFRDEVLGIVLEDFDLKQHDLIETVVLIPEKSQRWESRGMAMKKRLERWIAQQPSESFDFCRGLRFPSKTAVEPVAVGDCPPGEGCALENSHWTLDTTPDWKDPWKWK